MLSNFNIDKRIYFALGGVLIFILVLTLVVKTTKNRPKTVAPTPTPINNPIPTVYDLKKTIKPTETPAPLPSQTGGLGPQEDEATKKLSEQKQELRFKTPLTQPNFTITFDYSQDKFMVSLKEPKEQSKTKFSEWLVNNYPAIPIDRFIIN